MEITVKIECDTLSAAIFALADALEGKHISVCAPDKTQVGEEAKAPQDKMAEPTAQTLTLEAVRDELSNLPNSKVKELMLEFGVKKLTDLDAASYPALLAKAGLGA